MTCKAPQAIPKRNHILAALLTSASLLPAAAAADDRGPPRNYFAHPAVEDRYGVIAPWYAGQNGQCDFRLRVGIETLKRYPWASPPDSVMAAPHFVFNGHWSIAPDGTIRVDPRQSDWDNGDIGQRMASLIFLATNYYRYSGDAAALGIVELTADYVLDYCQTPGDHPWPGFFISCPTKGKAYGRADPRGFIQLDLSAQGGSAMLAAYKLTGNPRYWHAARRWAALLARHCDLRPGATPWNRYANSPASGFSNRMTGGIVLVLRFLDEMIRAGYRGEDDIVVKARDAGDRHLREVILPQWSADRTWGHHFWDWENPVNTCSLPWYASLYMIERPEAFPQWKSDVRNVLSLFLARSSVDPASAGGVYSGAWAVPESSGCCGVSLQYPTQDLAAAMLHYGAAAGDSWAREIGRRQALLSTYDAHENGVVEDGIHGGVLVTGAWFNLAHPWPLRCVLEMLAWEPELLGANRENHIMRSSAVVEHVVYGRGRVAYRTSDAAAPCEDVLRLAFTPNRVLADGKPLAVSPAGAANGYRIKQLANGDAIVTVRHDGCRNIVVEGDDPQQIAEDDALQYSGQWETERCAEAGHPLAGGGGLHVAFRAGADASFAFEGNQVRLLGRFGPDGGKADVILDGVKQPAPIDCWCRHARDQQILYYKNGLAQGKHLLRVVLLGTRNPVSQGTRLWLDAVLWSAAQVLAPTGEGGGPKEPQRVIFGYLGRADYRDSQGRMWRPATEFVLRLGQLIDVVPAALLSKPQLAVVAGTADAELYRYGAIGRDFTAYFTVAPAESYHVLLKFCQAARPTRPGDFVTSVDLQGETVVREMDIAATAGGLGRAVDLVFNRVRPVHGVIAVRFWNPYAARAMVQAIEIGPGDVRPGAHAVPVKPAQR